MKTKEQNKKYPKQNKGITLIALVITIIVLLILAGVAINMAINSDGLFGKATESAERWNVAVKNESDSVTELDMVMTTILDPSALIPGSYNSEGKLLKTWAQLKEDGDVTFGYEGYEYEGEGAGDPSYLTGVSSEIEYIIIDGSEVKTLTAQPFKNNDVIKSVKVTEGLETVEYKAFNGSDSIEEVVLPNSLKTVAQGVFQQSSVKSGRIHKDVEYGKQIYYSCPQLENITIDEGVTTITESMIRECPLLKKVVVPASVTSIGNYAFRDNINLAEIYILSPDVTFGSSVFLRNSGNFTIYVVNEEMKQRCQTAVGSSSLCTIEIIDT